MSLEQVWWRGREDGGQSGPQAPRQAGRSQGTGRPRVRWADGRAR